MHAKCFRQCLAQHLCRWCHGHLQNCQGLPWIAGSVFTHCQFLSPKAGVWGTTAEPAPWALCFPVMVTKEGAHLQDVVPGVVTVVTDTNLRAHVPAAEGTGAELQATNLQKHVGHSGEAVPLQPQVLEPLKPVESKATRLTMGWGGSLIGRSSIWEAGMPGPDCD